uniref:Uncharacterized protein n=1 Tax=Anguilla anguilla TaxID=7936 RepID=A0A0E9UD69_ANGAN
MGLDPSPELPPVPLLLRP